MALEEIVLMKIIYQISHLIPVTFVYKQQRVIYKISYYSTSCYKVSSDKINAKILLNCEFYRYFLK
jgi:hypothetical protein